MNLCFEPCVDEAFDDSESENEDDETLSQRIINQALEENKLDEAAGKDGVDVSKINKPTNKKIINTEEEVSVIIRAVMLTDS